MGYTLSSSPNFQLSPKKQSLIQFSSSSKRIFSHLFSNYSNHLMKSSHRSMSKSSKRLLRDIIRGERALRRLKAMNWRLTNKNRVRCNSCDKSHRTPFKCSRCEKGVCVKTSFLLCLTCKDFLLID